MVQSVIAFQGIAGANSEMAIRQHFGNGVKTYPCTDLTELFATIQSGKVDTILLPVENAFAGSVSGAHELLLDHDFRIQAEIIHHVHHNLVVNPGTTMDDLEIVRSHPQALAQCERYLKRHNLRPERWYDTAGSAQDLKKSNKKNIGAIASKLAAEIYELEILDSAIEDVPFNLTRFFLLGNEDPPRSEYNKTSIVFATRNQPSALYNCLGEFASRGINLTKIESRPRRNRPWEPVFYVDFEGHWQDEPCQEALMQLLQQASFVKMLGSYPAVKNNSVGI